MQLSTFEINMCILHCMVIMLHLADGIKPATSTILDRLSSQGGGAGLNPGNRSPKERMAMSHILQKSKADSNSLSFAFNLPVQRKPFPFNSNASKKPFLTGWKNATKNRGENAFKKVLSQRPGGKEKGNYTTKYNNGNTFEMVGVPLTFNSQGSEARKIDKGVNVSQKLPTARFGASAGTLRGRPKIEWKAITPPYEKYKGISPTTQFKHQSGNIPLDEEIIVMGEPLIFTKEGQKVSDTLNHAAQDGSVNYGTQGGNISKGDMPYSGSGVHFHNLSVPVKVQANGNGVRGQDAQVASQLSNHVDFYNKTTIQNDTEVELLQGPKQNLNNTYDYLPVKVHNNTNSQQADQWAAQENNAKQNLNNTYDYLSVKVHNNTNSQQADQWAAQENNASQAGKQEEVDGHGTDVITDDVHHNNKSVNSSSVAFDEESLTPSAFVPPFQTSEQNQTEVIYENGRDPEGGHHLEDSENLTNYPGNDTNEAYDNQESKNENEAQSYGSEENTSALPNSQEESVGTEEEQLDNSQSINDDASNLEQNQEIKDDEKVAGNQVTPVSKQRYMPVDEFGSPFYGNETDDYFQREALAAHNKYRAIHRAPALELSQQLSREAQHFANQLAKLGVARHDVNENLIREGEGDNVARGCSEWGGLTASGAVHRWYTQVCYVDWNKRTIQPSTKNFMQLIWKGTSHMGIGRAFGMRKGLPCTFIVARYRPGVINSYGLQNNIDKGLFLPSYCNAEKDEGLMSTGFPSSFFLDSMIEQRDQSPSENYEPPSSFKNTAGTPNGTPYSPLGTWENNIDAQDVRDLLKEQTSSKAAYSFLPRINLAENRLEEGRNQGEISMVVDDDAWKRSNRPSRGEESIRQDKHGIQKSKKYSNHVSGT